MGNMEALFVVACWVVTSAVVTHGITSSSAKSSWQDRLIEAELAEFVVDPTTGDTTFIIYAEQTK